jgi:hypothetical protein
VEQTRQRRARYSPGRPKTEAPDHCRPNPDNAAEFHSQSQNRFCVGMYPSFLHDHNLLDGKGRWNEHSTKAVNFNAIWANQEKDRLFAIFHPDLRFLY